MSEYEWLVELAAKGMAERDNHPMSKSVTTPEAFYEVMARAALDAIGLRALLHEVGAGRTQRDLKTTDEAPTQTAHAAHAAHAETATTPRNKPPVSTQHAQNATLDTQDAPLATHDGWDDGVPDTESRHEGTTRKAEKIRLRRKWAATAEEHLAIVTAAVERLRKALETEREPPSDASAEAASEVVAACGSLAEWLGRIVEPKGLAKAEGELCAAAAVYLNAAVTVLTTGQFDGDERHARCNACTMLLEQGDHHVESFVAALAKKLGDGVAVEERSTGAAETPAG